MIGSRKHIDERENHDRWLFSYADFITLMFAFFVVMYATSQADRDRARRLSAAVDDALKHGRVSSKVNEMLHGRRSVPETQPAKPVKMAELHSPLEELKRLLRDDIAKGRIDIRMEGRGLVISLNQAAFFPTGDSTILTSGYDSIAKVAGTLQKIPNPIRLEGHTDSVPIRNGQFASNWHLSAARSIAMLDLMTGKFGIPPERLAVVGYGDTVPVDTNDTEAGRARNRRVDITVLNDSAFTKEPSAQAQAKSGS